jgi:hypothetical protein
MPMPSTGSTPGQDLRRLVLGFRLSQAIYVAAEVGIAELLADGPRSAEELAAATGAHAPSLYRVLRFLAGEGIFAEMDDGRFSLTPMGELLRDDAPGSLRPMARQSASDASWRSWGQLLHSVQTGRPAFDRVHGVDFFEYYRQHPGEQAIFDALMRSYTEPVTRAVAQSYDFSPFSRVVDVGGGRGALTLGLLAEYPHLRGVVFDQPEVARAAQQAIEAAGQTGRCQAVGGDFFQAVPEGGDVYLLKFILHDWNDEQCIAILRACRSVMPGNGRVLVIELLIPPGNVPSFAKSQDVTMLVNLGGRERSEIEYRSLFASAGFELTRSIPADGELHIIEGRPI